MICKSANRQMSDAFRTALFVILSGGFQDAYTCCCRGEVFANAQTGNIVLMSSAFFVGDWNTVLKYVVPIISFLIGTAVAELIHMRFKTCEKIHWRQIILIIEIILLFAVGYIPQQINALANALVSFVCAMQVQTFHKVRGHAYASTMCIGNMRSGIESLCTYFHVHDKIILKKAMTYFSVIAVFAVGAGIGTVITNAVGIKAIWLCCLLLFVSFSIMFIAEEKSEG